MILFNGKYVEMPVIMAEDEESLAAALRSRRDRLLKESDKFMLPDYPISEKQRAAVEAYREDLRRLPELEEFPYIDKFPVLELSEVE